jgi:short-subunit dehydrogenase
MSYKLAMVTGASSGIGEKFADRLAQEGIDLILVARNKKKLNEVSKELKKNYNIKTHIISSDISDMNEVNKLIKKADKVGKIDLLINNAGFGSWGEFDKLNLSNELNMIDLNIKGFYILLRHYASKMSSMKKQCGIINTASVAGILPAPLYANYGATKSYVRQVSEAIRIELSEGGNKNTKIMVLSPGAVETNFAHVAMDDKNAKNFTNGMLPEEVAEVAWNDFLLGKNESIPGSQNQLYVLMNSISRTMVGKEVYKLFKKVVK